METKAVNTTAELEKELGMSEQELFGQANTTISI